MVLEYREDGTLVTGDEEPAVLGRQPLNPDGGGSGNGGGKGPMPGRLLRFAIGPGGMQASATRSVGAPFMLAGLASLLTDGLTGALPLNIAPAHLRVWETMPAHTSAWP